MQMDEMKRATWVLALAIGAGVFMLFACTFRVSTITALVILLNSVLLGIYSVISASRGRYLLLVILTGLLALELVLRREGSSLFMLSVLIRFLAAGLLITFFTTLLTQSVQKLYLNMHRLALERKAALSRVNALVGVITAISTKNRLREIFTDGLDEAMKVFGADSGLVYGVDPDTGGVSIMSSFGYDGELLETMERKGVGNIRSCQACSLMKPVVVDDLATDDKCHYLSGIDTGSSICLPITSGEDLRGNQQFTDTLSYVYILDSTYT